MKTELTQKNKLRWIAWVIFLILLILISHFIYKRSTISKDFTFYSLRIKSWLTKPNVKLNASNSKQTEPQIHFEFYTALPNMQIDAPITPDKKLKRRVIRIVEAKELEQELARELQQE